MYTGVFGAGLIWFIGRPDVPARKGLGAGLMLTAMLMHGLWDASAAIGGNSVFGWIVPATVAGRSSPCSSGSTRTPCRSSASGCAS